jgi:hypothetical protein
MKTKALFWFIFLGIITASFTSKSFSSVLMSNTEKEIELHGSLSNIQPRILLPNPIEAFINSSGLNAIFLSNLGDIDVVVYDASGAIVHQQTVNTQTEQQLTIDLYSWDKGVYQVKFINSTGQFMYGTFEII